MVGIHSERLEYKDNNDHNALTRSPGERTMNQRRGGGKRTDGAIAKHSPVENLQNGFLKSHSGGDPIAAPTATRLSSRTSASPAYPISATLPPFPAEISEREQWDQNNDEGQYLASSNAERDRHTSRITSNAERDVVAVDQMKRRHGHDVRTPAIHSTDGVTVRQSWSTETYSQSQSQRPAVSLWRSPDRGRDSIDESADQGRGLRRGSDVNEGEGR